MGMTSTTGGMGGSSWQQEEMRQQRIWDYTSQIRDANWKTKQQGDFSSDYGPSAEDLARESVRAEEAAKLRVSTAQHNAERSFHKRDAYQATINAPTIDMEEEGAGPIIHGMMQGGLESMRDYHDMKGNDFLQEAKYHQDISTQFPSMSFMDLSNYTFGSPKTFD
jgi:hypothetical protein